MSKIVDFDLEHTQVQFGPIAACKNRKKINVPILRDASFSLTKISYLTAVKLKNKSSIAQNV